VQLLNEHDCEIEVLVRVLERSPQRLVFPGASVIEKFMIVEIAQIVIAKRALSSAILSLADRAKMEIVVIGHSRLQH
jgi:hypothetical protein